jgi:hypothetical protein
MTIMGIRLALFGIVLPAMAILAVKSLLFPKPTSDCRSALPSSGISGTIRLKSQ